MVDQDFRVKIRPMLQLVVDRPPAIAHPAPQPADEFGVWTGYDIPLDRTDWHPLACRLYDYWQSLAPPGRLPGRQDLVPEDIAPLWSRAWMLDVFRDPLRYRYRLCGTEMVRSLGGEVTGQWLDEVHPALIANPQRDLAPRVAAMDPRPQAPDDRDAHRAAGGGRTHRRQDAGRVGDVRQRGQADLARLVPRSRLPAQCRDLKFDSAILAHRPQKPGAARQWSQAASGFFLSERRDRRRDDRRLARIGGWRQARRQIEIDRCLPGKSRPECRPGERERCRNQPPLDHSPSPSHGHHVKLKASKRGKP